ncbi:hypothetical protein glysoja_035859 [Glycine soja]|uniref:Replication factor A C-terminal domain-containing protein n=1 Tax=Glycine soja TaxID=3848 RepID=A0A0B2R953_GLYSO|nr:hypothetical protein glysoja_035859 [Glycine soja]
MFDEGTKIGATLWQELFPEFEPKLRCGGAYVIQNVKVVDTHSDYKVSVAKPDTLVDIVGVIAEVIECKTVNPAYKVTVKLRDNSHVEIIMTVWEEYALQLDDAIEKNHFVQKPLVVMLTLAKIKEPKDDEGGVSQSQSTQNCQHKFLHNAQIVSFGEIKTLRQDCYCLTVGTVDEVMIDTPWSYDSCPYCTITFDPLKIGAACRSCQNHVTHTIPRYKLVVKMEQNGEKANFHFWDAVCIKIFGKTADECRQELIASGDEIKVFPACVDQLLGKTWVVRFKHRIQMHQSSVLDFSEQEHHIQSVISTLGLQSSEYDPGNAAFVTPAKRTSDQQGSSQFDSDNFTAYELSTNKHIKAE